MCAQSLTAATLQLLNTINTVLYAVNEATDLIADKILFVNYSYLITYEHLTESLPNLTIQIINVCFEEFVSLGPILLTLSADNLEQT